MKKLINFSLTLQFLVLYGLSVAVDAILSVQVVFLRNWQMAEVRPVYIVMTPIGLSLTVLFLVRGGVKAVRHDKAKRNQI